MLKSRLYAHRGLWNERGIKVFEPNSKSAILNAISKGFKVETDLRDFIGEIVIGHDPQLKNIFSLDELLNFHGSYALNIKSDGLIPGLTELLTEADYFLFDMSIPEYQKYLKTNLNVFGRLSEFETSEQYVGASGYWVDGLVLWGVKALGI
jgi:hypothetical protein